MIRRYILVDREPVLCPDLVAWGEWMEDEDNVRVASTHIGTVWVSTVFLGLDHNWGRGRPLLFETMAFCGDVGENIEMDRCSTWAEAEAMHRRCVDRAVELVRAADASIAAVSVTGGAS